MPGVRRCVGKRIIMSKLFLAFVAALCTVGITESTGSINDIEHIIIFMQENRAFDHYFGTLSGVRGFNDRTPVPLRSGLNAFYQPIDQSDLSQYMLPFRVDPEKTNSMCAPAPQMWYPSDLEIYNDGRSV